MNANSQVAMRVSTQDGGPNAGASSQTLTLAFPSLKKANARRYGAKVKTGCRTCKIRRVKCDERKPECARCTNTGRKCDGYTDNPQAPVSSQSSTIQRTVPLLSISGDDVLYLEFFCYLASASDVKGSGQEFWARTVPQMAQSEPTLRHAVIAMACLIKTEPINMKHPRVDSMVNGRKPFLSRYNTAVRCLIDRLTDPSYSVEVGLITCLIFICIELLRGDYHSVFTHLLNALKIVAELQRKRQDKVQREPASPMSTYVPGFLRAIATSILFGGPFEPLIDNVRAHPQTFQDRPFTSVLEARLALYRLRNAAMRQILLTTQQIENGAQPTAEVSQYQGHLLKCHDSWLWALQSLEREGDMSSEDSIIASSFKVPYYSTYIALACITDTSRMRFDEHTSSFKALNRHARIVLDSMVLPGSTPSETTATPTRSHTSSSCNNVSTPHANSSNESLAYFTSEISLIPALFFAATRCRCPVTRRESVFLLARSPPQVAHLWEPMQHAIVAKRIIQLEEKEVDEETGWPVEKARLSPELIMGIWAEIADSGFIS